MEKLKNILVITYWPYNDALIQTYTLPYLQIINKILPNGSTIYLVTLENTNKTNYTLPQGIQHIPLSYSRFGLKAAIKWLVYYFKLNKIIRKNNISYIHAWCTPAGAIAYLLSKRSGKPLIIDSYEPHAEAMVENGTWSRKSIAYKILFFLEKKQTHFAKFLIAAAHGMENYALEKYGYTGKNFYYKPACVNLDVFNLSIKKPQELVNKYNLENKLICIYAGKLGGIYYDDEIFKFISFAENKFGDNFRFILLSNYSDENLRNKCIQFSINQKTIIKTFVPHHEIVDFMALADFAICPVKPVPTKRYCSPIKIGEYLATGLPIIISKHISEDSDMLKENNLGFVLEEYTNSEFENALNFIVGLISKNDDYKQQLNHLASIKRNFKIAEDVYRKIYLETASN